MITRLVVLLALLFGVGAYVYATPQKPTLIVEESGIKISLYQSQPCTDEKMLQILGVQIREEFVSKFRAAFLMWYGEPYKACYLELGEEPDQMILIIGEDGEPINPPYGIPKSLFQPEGI